MFKELFCVFCVLTLLLAVAVETIASAARAGQERGWTIIVYLCGDNNLSSQALADLNELEGAVSSVDAYVLALVDQSGVGDTRAYEVAYDADGPMNEEIVSKEVPLGEIFAGWEGKTELNLADPNTLSAFSRWCIETYPAERLALVVWDHGDGWMKALGPRPLSKDVCYDGYDSMDVSELKSALEECKDETGRALDIVGMDACLMGMVEVAYQLREVCKVFVASEESVPTDGWDYGFVSQIKPGSDLDARTLAAYIVDYYYNSYTDGRPQPADQSQIVLAAVDTGSLSAEFLDATNQVARLLIATMQQHHSQVRSAYLSSYTMQDYSWYVDFKDFMLSIAAERISEGITSAAQEAASALDSAVFYVRKGLAYPYCFGLSIYFEPSEAYYDDRYDGDSGFLDFTADSLWDELLHSYYDPESMVPQIEHTPLHDTEGENEEITVDCIINSQLPLAEEKVRLFWASVAGGKAHQDFTQVVMHKTGVPQQFAASIPGQPYETKVSYYIYAENIAGGFATSPADAPQHVYSFWVRQDRYPPVIEHTPLGNQPEGKQAFTVLCTVRDNLGVDKQSVKLLFHLAKTTDATVSMQAQGNDHFTGRIPADGVVAGDRIWYRITASDLAKARNESWLPADGYFSFSIVPSLGSVLLVDDGSGQSASVFSEILASSGYAVERFSPGEVPPSGQFDIVVYSLGDSPTPVPAFHRELVDYVLAGGRLLIESGDLAYTACIDRAALLSDLRTCVLHINGWHADLGDDLIIKSPTSYLATTPNLLEASLTFGGTSIESADVCYLDAESFALYTWTRYAYPGVIFYDDDADETNGGQIVYMTFALPYLSDVQGQRTELVQNCLFWLSNYPRDKTPPAIENLYPPSGATVAPHSSIGFVMTDYGTGVDRSSIELLINGGKVSPRIQPLNGSNRIAVSFKPEGGFRPNSRFEVSIGGCDFAGNCLSHQRITFRTGSQMPQPPEILAAGFMQSGPVRAGETLTVVALARSFGEGNFVVRVELFYDGSPLGIFLNDEGKEGDQVAGDSIFSGLVPVAPGTAPGLYLIQIVAFDAYGQASAPWPDLAIRP